MLQTLKPTVIGHFDLVRIFRPEFPLSPTVWDKIKRNIQYIKEYGGLVEINSRAYKKGLKDPYPCRSILSAMKELGVRFTLSDDSHGFRDIGMHYNKLVDYLKEMEIQTIWYPKLVDAEGSAQMEVIAWDGYLHDPFWSALSNDQNFSK